MKQSADQKEILTREKCRTDLQFLFRKHLGFFPILLILMLLIYLFLLAMVHIYTILRFLIPFLWLLPLAILIWYVCDVLSLKHMIKTGAFTVTQDTLSRIKQKNRGWKHYRQIVFIMYFSSCGKYTASDRLCTWDDMTKMTPAQLIASSTCGDAFYIVTSNRRKRKAMLVYNTRLFEWKEE